jgi:hypothetical protein
MARHYCPLKRPNEYCNPSCAKNEKRRGNIACRQSDAHVHDLTEHSHWIFPSYSQHPSSGSSSLDWALSPPETNTSLDTRSRCQRQQTFAFRKVEFHHSSQMHIFDCFFCCIFFCNMVCSWDIERAQYKELDPESRCCVYEGKIQCECSVKSWTCASDYLHVMFPLRFSFFAHEGLQFSFDLFSGQYWMAIFEHVEHLLVWANVESPFRAVTSHLKLSNVHGTTDTGSSWRVHCSIRSDIPHKVIAQRKKVL